jgi:hypothetical protein
LEKKEKNNNGNTGISISAPRPVDFVTHWMLLPERPREDLLL